MADYIGVYLVYISCELNCRNFNISNRISFTFAIRIWLASPCPALILRPGSCYVACIFIANHITHSRARVTSNTIQDSLITNQGRLGLAVGKPVFGGLRTTQAQTSLRIRAV